MYSVQYQPAALMQPTYVPTGLTNLVPSRTAQIKLSDLVPFPMAHLFRELKEPELTDPYESCDMYSQHEI